MHSTKLERVEKHHLEKKQIKSPQQCVGFGWLDK